MTVAKIFLLVTSVVLAETAFSQSQLNELTVDRPGIAESPFTVAPGTYQFEIGFDYFKRYKGEIYNLPVGLFRTGLTKKVELRISSRSIVDKTDGGNLNNVTPLSVGAKMHVIKQNEWIPETDILANVIVPIGTQGKNVGYEMLLLFQHDFYPNTAINYNVGYLWDNNRSISIFTASFCFNYLPTQRIGLFAEYFEFVPDQWPGEQGIDGGMTYLVGPKLQLDLSAGISRLDHQNNLFVSSGLSFRIN